MHLQRSKLTFSPLLQSATVLAFAHTMARSLRRSNPVTLILALILFMGFLVFIISPSHPVPVIANSKIAFPSSKRVPSSSRPPVIHYYFNNLTTSADPIGNREKVLILTPVARFYQDYWRNLLALSYPRDLIELGFIVPKTHEGNAALAKLDDAVHRVQTGPRKNRFAGVTIIRQDFDTVVPQNEKERHALSAQKDRRAAMSRARNSLLFTTLGTETAWVLWLDADIVETPPSLIQDLASHDKAVIVPNCFQRYKEKGEEKVRPYDFNSWHDSDTALAMASKMGSDEIILEGYREMATYRSLMAYERIEGGDPSHETELDGVGGTALLVKAEVHRDGAMFPPFPFYNLIETEGFAKMARRLGHQPFGLPNYLVSFCFPYPQRPSHRANCNRFTTITNSPAHFLSFVTSISFPIRGRYPVLDWPLSRIFLCSECASFSTTFTSSPTAIPASELMC